MILMEQTNIWMKKTACTFPLQANEKRDREEKNEYTNYLRKS